MKKSNISYSDFQKLDIRTGTVIDAEFPKWSHWVVKLSVDFGSTKEGGLGKKTVFAGIMGFYKPEDLVGKQFSFVTNLEPKTIGPKGDVSEAMLLAAIRKLKKPVIVDGEDAYEKPVFLCPQESVENGAKVR